MSQTGWQQPAWGTAAAPMPAGAMPPPPMPAQPQPMQWTAPTHPGPKTDLLALLAIGAAALGTTVFVGLGSLAAIVLGFIALRRIARTGDDGRLLAIWAILLGIATIVAIIASTIIGIGAFLAIAEQFGALGV
ncbi:DUF4190 domain-containing protein [Agrococcus sp. KRD186]|uniref:DUF4190 domain-containing protein n=1 Tax=Agrococcus sp. KRD186 TaxID=2729730 RepID=UPI0019CF7A2D|nr:DUF4190 domain-containing protein [Agrococcus sp. KRD186]